MWSGTSERAARFGVALSLAALAACADTDTATAPPRVPRRPSLVTASVVTVTNTNNDGPGSLRDAIANALESSVIQFDPSIAGQTILLNSTGLSIIQSELTIDGPVPGGIIISGGGAVPLFSIGNGRTLVTIRNLTLTNGYAKPFGGAIAANIFSNLTLDHVLVSGNTAVTEPPFREFPENPGKGGAIYTSGTLTLLNSTITGNSATGAGGGIWTSSTLTVTNSTIAGNSAPSAGGIWMENNAVFHSTIVANNSATTDANCHLESGANLNYTGTNIASDVSCGTNPNLAIADPGLSPLANNGGPTWTMALAANSPAIDATDCAVTDDQRHIARPQGRRCDIGAFEFNDFVNAALTVDPSGAVSLTNGVAVISGAMPCSAPATIPLSVSLSQTQKLKRVQTSTRATGTTTVACNGKTFWAVALAPPSGGFEAGDATVTANTVAGVAILPASRTSPVKLVWQKK